MKPTGAPVWISGAVVLAVGAQYAAPGAAFFHGWQYALILVALIVPLARAAWIGRGERRAVALAGVLVVAVAGLASGLMGPDTLEVERAPGTVAALPDLGVAAFFGSADAAAVGRGDASVVLRRRGGAAIEMNANERRFVGASVVYLTPHIAAYLEARSAAGDRLTVTQPTNPSFLSPVLLFRTSQAIAGKTLPFDTFALPGAHRVVRAVYFSAAETQSMQHLARSDAGKPAVLFAVNDEAGQPLGITIAPSGHEVRVGGVALRAVLGQYPVLEIASAPYPAAIVVGVVLILAGSVWNAIRSARVHPWTSSSRRLPSESE